MMRCMLVSVEMQTGRSLSCPFASCICPQPSSRCRTRTCGPPDTKSGRGGRPPGRRSPRRAPGPAVVQPGHGYACRFTPCCRSPNHRPFRNRGHTFPIRFRSSSIAFLPLLKWGSTVLPLDLLAGVRPGPTPVLSAAACRGGAETPSESPASCSRSAPVPRQDRSPRQVPPVSWPG